MPTILLLDGYRFFFYSRETNEPPHIHVQRVEGLAKFWLEPIRLAKSDGFAAKDLRRLSRIIEEYQTLFLEKWHDYFSN